MAPGRVGGSSYGRPGGLYWLDLVEIHVTLSEIEPGDFEVETLRDAIDGWLTGLAPGTQQADYEWSSDGARVRLRARPRAEMSRGWTAMPSLTLLEQPVGDLQLVPGGRRAFISLSLEDVTALATG